MRGGIAREGSSHFSGRGQSRKSSGRVPILGKLGYTAVIANNGNEVLDLLKRQNFDVVLMDVQMPEMDGITATRKIREYEKSTIGHIPIIAMTAHALNADRIRAFRAGEHRPFDRLANCRSGKNGAMGLHSR
jgi:CheY-like chemotaxis protein